MTGHYLTTGLHEDFTIVRAIRHLHLNLVQYRRDCDLPDVDVSWPNCGVLQSDQQCKLTTLAVVATTKGLNELQLEGDFRLLVEDLPSLPDLTSLRLQAVQPSAEGKPVSCDLLIAALRRQPVLLQLELSRVHSYNPPNSELVANSNHNDLANGRKKSAPVGFLPDITARSLTVLAFPMHDPTLAYLLTYLQHLKTLIISRIRCDTASEADDSVIVNTPSTHLASALRQYQNLWNAIIWYKS